MNENKTNINWYPGHMLKTKKQIIEDLKLIDVVVELLDARIPKSSKNPDIQKIVQNKKISVFVPTTPNPTSGFLIFLPENDVVKLDMSVEDGIKYVISCGIVTPTELKNRIKK